MVRNVKIISVFLAVVLIFSFPLSCFAVEDLSHGESLMWDNFFNTLGEINKVAITCPKCGAGIRKKDGGTCPSCGFNASIDDGTVNNYRPGSESGGGSASPGGVGRHPSGYSGQGKPTVNSSGVMILSVPLDGVLCTTSYSDRYFVWVDDNQYNSSVSRETFFKKNYFAGPLKDDGTFPSWSQAFYTFKAPADGVYFWSKYLNGYEFRHVNYYFQSGSMFQTEDKFDFSESTNYFHAAHYNKGDIVHFVVSGCTNLDKAYKDNVSNYNGCTLAQYSFYPALVCFEPDPDSSTLSNKTNITINNNTFNGNIYVDNSNKLTYIYPQYTVNNETKISNNPIIYNEETKQYYTYDQTTNNYYYITYGDPAPSPTPSPSPDPGGSGGGSSGGDGSGGGSDDNPSGGASSWWEKLLDKLGSALIDGLLDAIKGILKLLFDLFSSILGWIIWLCSKVFDLFPFLPPGVGALLVGGVVVCFVLAFIKFIRG